MGRPSGPLDAFVETGRLTSALGGKMGPHIAGDFKLNPNAGGSKKLEGFPEWQKKYDGQRSLARRRKVLPHCLAPPATWRVQVQCKKSQL